MGELVKCVKSFRLTWSSILMRLRALCIVCSDENTQCDKELESTGSLLTSWQYSDASVGARKANMESRGSENVLITTFPELLIPNWPELLITIDFENLFWSDSACSEPRAEVYGNYELNWKKNFEPSTPEIL